MIARAIPGAWLGRFFGFWTGAGNLVGIGGAALAAALLAGVAWPLNFALCFALTFVAMVVSFVLLSLGREPPRAQHIIASRENDSTDAASAAQEWMRARRAELREQWRLVRADGGLRRLLLSNGLAGIATMAGALFAVAALKQGGLSDAEVGAENTVLFVGMTAANILWGTIGDRFGHKAVLVGSALAAAASALLALSAHGFWAYALVFALFGVNVAGANLAGLTFIAEFGPAVRRPTYVALASVAYAPFVIGAPLLGGVLADHWGYAPVFWLSGVAGLLALVAYQFWVPDPRKRARVTA
jgi:predicted MFS family arabinose efflux permease